MLPPSDYFKPEIKELVSKVETKLDKSMVISKVTKVEVVKTSSGNKYQFVVENDKGQEVEICAVQING